MWRKRRETDIVERRERVEGKRSEEEREVKAERRRSKG